MRYLFISLTLLLILYSCEQEVSIVLQESEIKPVINSVFSPESLFSVAVYKSNSLDTIDNAIVELYSSNLLIETLPYLGNGVYQSYGFRVEEEVPYSIVVDIPGFDPVMSDDIVPGVVPIESITHQDSTGITQYNARYASFEISLNDPPVQENYYEVFITQQIDTSNLVLADSIRPDIYIDGISMRERWKQGLVFNVMNLFSYDPSIKAEGFIDQSSGVFEQYFLYFNDAFFDGEKYSMTIHYFPYYNEQYDHTYYLVPERHFTIYLRSISRNYYEFRKSQLLYTEYQNQDAIWRNAGDFIHIYSNVTNGYGLFAGYSTAVDSLMVVNNFE